MISMQPAFRYGALGALMLAVAGCTAIPQADAPPAPRPAPAPTPTPTPLPTPAGSWEDRTVEAGAWRYDASGRTASFVPTGTSNPILTMACSASSIRLTSALAGTVRLRTSAGTDEIRFDGGGANLTNRDPRLDRIAFSRGRFALEMPGGSALTLPVQSEIGRVIEDCR